MKFFWLVLTLMLYSGAALAAQEVRVELLDGSILRGEVVGFDGGRYRVRSPHLGVVELPEAEIRSLSFGGAPVRDAGSSAWSGQIDAVQRGLASDDKTLAMIMDLLDDPQFQAILNDPELMRAVVGGDLQSLSANPAITRLLGDPRIRAIQRQSGLVPGD